MAIVVIKKKYPVSLKFSFSTPRHRSEKLIKNKVMISKESFIKTVSFMTLGVGILVLGMAILVIH